jgi:hypothetical protein
MLRWQQVNPKGFWILVKSDVNQEATSGGILLTQELPGSAQLGYYTGDILRFGDKVLSFLNMNREKPLTSEDLLNKKLIYKHYLSDVIKFLCKDDDNRNVFMIHIADPNLNIIGLSEGEKIQLI